MSYEQFKAVGYYELPIDETPYVGFAAFRKDPAANPLNTPSGKDRDLLGGHRETRVRRLPANAAVDGAL